jgi:nitroreductase
MDFFKVIEKRRSMRKYADRQVEEKKLRKILEAANRAPSAGNLQAYEIFVARHLALRQALASAALDQQFIAEAPVVLVFCINPDRAKEKYEERGTSLYCLQDATIACAYAQLAAKALGLDTVWVGAFDETEASRSLHLPGNLRPIALLPVGYAGRVPGERPRRDLADLVHEVGITD